MGFGADVSTDELRRQIERIRAIDIEGMTVLAGSEINILPDGSLDYPDDVLAELDWTVASVHTSFRMSPAAMTERMIAAMEHPYVDCIGHLSGRKLGTRPGYELEFDRVLEAALATGTLLEINSSPVRRDINEVWARTAAAAGLAIVINTDSHRPEGFAARRYGVATARRAGLTPAQILNTRPWPELSARLKRNRQNG